VRRVVLGLAFISILACGGDTGGRDAFAVRDSAGIQIIESTAAQWTGTSSWQLESPPAVEIGLVEGPPEYLFSLVEGALFLPDGGIVVADRASSQIRYFDRRGAFQGFVGGPGEGPGELDYIRGLGRCGADSVFVFEIDFNTVVFSPDRAYVREARPFDAERPHLRPYALRCAPNGAYVAVGWEPRLSSPAQSGPIIGFYRAESPAWLLVPAGEGGSEGRDLLSDAGLAIQAELGTFLSSERIGNERGSRPHPFARAARFAITDEAAYVGTGESSEIRRYSLSGQLERIIRWPELDLTIHDAELQTYRAAQLDSVAEDRRPALNRSLAEMPMPSAFPAFVRIEADRLGNLWIEPFRKPSEAGDLAWTVIGAEGALLGNVTIPRDFELMDFGDDAVVGVARDELGVERIRVYRVSKTGAR
jgi:hypothetical protein